MGIIEFLLSLSKAEFVKSAHFIEQCKYRNLDSLKVMKIIENNIVQGLLQQGENKYKVWYKLDKNKDLNIIMGVLPNNKIKLITLFPTMITRRVR